MSTDNDAVAHRPEDDMLPDEREAIAERAESLEDEESKLSVDEIAENLGIDLD